MVKDGSEKTENNLTINDYLLMPLANIILTS